MDVWDQYISNFQNTMRSSITSEPIEPNQMKKIFFSGKFICIHDSLHRFILLCKCASISNYIMKSKTMKWTNIIIIILYAKAMVYWFASYNILGICIFGPTSSSIAKEVILHGMFISNGRHISVMMYRLMFTTSGEMP